MVRWACGPVVRWAGNFAGRLVSYWEIGQVQVFGYDTVGGQVSKVCSIKVTRRTCVGKVQVQVSRWVRGGGGLSATLAFEADVREWQCARDPSLSNLQSPLLCCLVSFRDGHWTPPAEKRAARGSPRK